MTTKKEKAAHTPGPWTMIVQKDRPTQVGISGPSSVLPGGFRSLATMPGDFTREDEYSANARLIAVAPSRPEWPEMRYQWGAP